MVWYDIFYKVFNKKYKTMKNNNFNSNNFNQNNPGDRGNKNFYQNIPGSTENKNNPSTCQQKKIIL